MPLVFRGACDAGKRLQHPGHRTNKKESKRAIMQSIEPNGIFYPAWLLRKKTALLSRLV
jgi:hypothetical protein